LLSAAPAAPVNPLAAPAKPAAPLAILGNPTLTPPNDAAIEPNPPVTFVATLEEKLPEDIDAATLESELKLLGIVAIKLHLPYQSQ
jgi:hypothetical protein